jgi:hypothetical protein
MEARAWWDGCSLRSRARHRVGGRPVDHRRSIHARMRRIGKGRVYWSIERSIPARCWQEHVRRRSIDRWGMQVLLMGSNDQVNTIAKKVGPAWLCVWVSTQTAEPPWERRLVKFGGSTIALSGRALCVDIGPEQPWCGAQDMENNLTSISYLHGIYTTKRVLGSHGLILVWLILVSLRG